MPVDINEIYRELYERYQNKYPHNPEGVLRVHLMRTRLPLKAGLIFLAVENGVRVQGIERLLGEGKSLKEASEALASEIRIDDSIVEAIHTPKPQRKGYVRRPIAESDALPLEEKVSLYGRLVALFVGKPLVRKTGVDEIAQFVLKDQSGMILVEVDYPLEITLMKGSVVKVNGEIRDAEGKRFVSASTVSKLQTVEDGFEALSTIGIGDIDRLPETEGSRLVKPTDARAAESVTVEKTWSPYVLYGCVLCIFSFIPVLGFFTCITGIILLLLGLTSPIPKIKEFETMTSIARLLLEHHPPWLRSRCLCLRLFERKIYVCARCTGTLLGALAAFILGLKISDPLIITLLAMPALMDWGTQKTGLRESSNSLRVITGFTLGSAINYSKYLSLGLRLGTALVFFAAMAIASYISTKTIPKQGTVRPLVPEKLPDFIHR